MILESVLYLREKHKWKSKRKFGGTKSDMKLIFIRHAEPDYEKDSLTPKGFREAELLAKRVASWDIKDIYCSPLGRAKATAKPSLELLGREAVEKDWLREFPAYLIDPLSGNRRILWDLMPNYWCREETHYDRNAWFESPLMQTGDAKEVWQRVCTGIDELLAEHGYEREKDWYRVREGNTDTLVFFCHLGITCAILAHLLGTSPLVMWHGIFMPPSCVTILQTEEREAGKAYFRSRAIADTAHLLMAGEPISEMGAFEEVSLRK